MEQMKKSKTKEEIKEMGRPSEWIREEGREVEKEFTAIRMLKVERLPLEEIVEYSGLSLEKVQLLKKEVVGR